MLLLCWHLAGGVGGYSEKQKRLDKGQVGMRYGTRETEGEAGRR